MLKIRSLTCGYGEKVVLHEISLTLQPGKILAVIGPNGAGKSTLIKAVSGVIPVTGGSIEWAGSDMLKLNPDERARLVSVVAQARNLPPAFTAWEVVSLGRTPYLNWLGQLSKGDDEIISQAMKETGTFDLANRMTGELSGGEQQRLFLARALSQQTPLLLLDEPTSHLDLQYQVQLIHLLRNLIHGSDKAALIVMHDLNLAARVSDQVALLVDGRVAAHGTPNEVMTEEILGSAYHVELGIIQDPETGESFILPRINA
jgi:iron complex transport system ATP-binding protein